MAEDNKKESSVSTNEEKKQTASKNETTVTLCTLVVILAIASMCLTFLTDFLGLFVGNYTVYCIFRCINLVVLAGAISCYLIDYFKSKTFSVNPAFICVVLAILVMMV